MYRAFLLLTFIRVECICSLLRRRALLVRALKSYINRPSPLYVGKQTVEAYLRVIVFQVFDAGTRTSIPLLNVRCVICAEKVHGVARMRCICTGVSTESNVYS